MFLIAFRYVVKVKQQQQFETYYGPTGEWAKFFRERCAGYVASELYELLDARARLRQAVWQGKTKQAIYLLQDRWVSQKRFEEFLDTHGHEYQLLSEKCEQLGLYKREERLGELSLIST